MYAIPNNFVLCLASTGLVVGLVVSAAALIVGAILLVYFLRLRKRKGLYVALTEPNYTQVAFQADLQLQYKINAHDDFKYDYFVCIWFDSHC